jgi:hypothetical protein
MNGLDAAAVVALVETLIGAILDIVDRQTAKQMLDRVAVRRANAIADIASEAKDALGPT